MENGVRVRVIGEVSAKALSAAIHYAKTSDTPVYVAQAGQEGLDQMLAAMPSSRVIFVDGSQ